MFYITTIISYFAYPIKYFNAMNNPNRINQKKVICN